MKKEKINTTKSYNNSILVKIEKITCSSCVNKIEKNVNKIGNCQAQVNLVTSTALIKHNGNVSRETIINTIKNLGYQLEVIEENTTENKKAQTPKWKKIQVEPQKINTNRKEINNKTSDKINELENKKLVNKNLANKYSLKLLISIITTITTLGIIIPFFPSNKNTIWIVALLSTIITLYCGFTFHKNAYTNLKNFHLNMDSLVSLSTLTSLAWSFYILFTQDNIKLHNHFTLNIETIHTTETLTHFDSAMMIITFILLGKWIENKTTNKGKVTIQEILDLEVKHATLLKEKNETKQILTKQIQIGDKIIVKQGEQIPTDGIILEGESEVDTSLITGENTPKYVKNGDEIIGGTINLNGTLIIKVTKNNKDTMLSQITQSVLNSQLHKPKIQKIVDKTTGIFTPLIVIIAIGATIIWATTNQNIHFAISCGITALIVACPCALGLATPLALIVTTGTATKKGILITNPQTLENITKINTMIFDKTGTLTKGELTIESIIPLENKNENEILELAYLAQRGANHPISQAIKTKFEKIKDNEKSKFFKYAKPQKHINYIGNGVEITVDKTRIYMGKAKWIQKLGYKLPEKTLRLIAQKEYTGSIVSIIATYDSTSIFDKEHLKPIGLIIFNDQIKPNAEETINYLKSEKITPILVTGDSQRNATYTASRIGINENNIYSQKTPIHKKEIIKNLQEKNQKVAMIGDGINDAPALSQASNQGISFCYAQGSDLSIYISDIVFLNNEISLVEKTFKLGKKTINVIKQNLFWAFIYNIIAIPLATVGYLNPSLAAISMVTSSIIVVLNSLRIQKSI